MSTHPWLTDRDDSPEVDHFVHLRGVTWQDYERVLEMRGDRSAPRIAYLEGDLEIMAPSKHHEGIKSMIGRLVEAYCRVHDIDCMPFGSWTLKTRIEERGAEPDECYVLGDVDAERPHLAIEVIWTSGGLDKLEIYRKLDVPEVWIWRKARLSVWVLREQRYVEAPSSEALPGIDLELLLSFLDRKSVTRAVREYEAALEGA